MGVLCVNYLYYKISVFFNDKNACMISLAANAHSLFHDPREVSYIPLCSKLNQPPINWKCNTYTLYQLMSINSLEKT